MCLLLLGGTADGRILAENLHKKGVPVIYSVAGLVRTPDVPCAVVTGGFTQFGGLVEYIKQKAITAVLDVTHPYAEKMSSTAIAAAKSCDIPCWRFHRPAWKSQPGDNWQYFVDWPSLSSSLKDKMHVFLSAGQIDQAYINSLANNSGQKQLLRTAVKPKIALPKSMHWIKAIGPFSYDNELSLMKGHHIDVLVSKNSGGDATIPKLTVARDLGIPVYFLERPELADADVEISTREECLQLVLEKFLPEISCD